LAVAELILRSELSARWVACFHAQQAAGKALKALLVARGIDFPDTHALEVLVDLLGRDGELFDRRKLIELSAWAVVGRYPDITVDPTVAQATHVVASARSALATARSQLSNSLTEPGDPPNRRAGDLPTLE
jgi:HEPN domain-containing protein